MIETVELLKQYPLQIDGGRLRGTLADVTRQLALYQEILNRYRAEYGCELAEFEQKILQGAVPEHPSWETAIEWGVAQDEYERLGVIRSALEWILNFLN